MLLVLGAHALLLQGWAPPSAGRGEPAAPQALEVRLVEPAPAAAEWAAAAPAVQPPRAASAAPPAVAAGPAAEVSPAAAPAGPRAMPPLPVQELITAQEPAAADAPVAAVVEAAPRGLDVLTGVGLAMAEAGQAQATPAVLRAAAQVPAAAANTEWLPTYATLLPPPLRWRYRLRRGLLSGVAVFDWQRSDAGYRLAIDGSVAGLPVFEWASTGGIDAHGVAPNRLVMRTVGRAARAANFQRDSGRITYSSHDAEHPLLPGTQDRVSWLVQLAGVVAAAPARFAAPPAQIAFQVSGVRGDLAVWRFDVVGEQAIDTSVGRVQALKLRREAERAFDTRGEIWLDPQRHHLPVRVVLSTIGREGEVTEALTLELESTR